MTFDDFCVSFLHILYFQVFSYIFSSSTGVLPPLALSKTLVPPASSQASQAQFEAPKGRPSTDSCPNLKLHTYKSHTNRRIQRCGKMCKEMQTRVSCISERIIYRRRWSRLRNHRHLQLKNPFLRGQNLNGARPTAAIPCRKRRNQHFHPVRV